MIRMVLADNEIQFREWCYANGINFRDRSVVRRIRDFQDLRGLGQPIKIEVLPGYWDRVDPNLRKIDLYYDALMIQERNKDLPDPGPTSR